MIEILFAIFLSIMVFVIIVAILAVVLNLALPWVEFLNNLYIDWVYDVQEKIKEKKNESNINN